MNREAWLIRATTTLAKGLFAPNGHDVPELHVSVGWPSRRATSVNNRTIGQCWYGENTADEQPQVFISPVLSDPVKVLETLAHELLHAVLPSDTKHGPAFKRAMASIGLEGKPTSTHAGEQLAEHLTKVADKLGKFPHASIDPKSKLPKQTTRLIKVECLDCGYTVRTTRKWLEVGAPICPTDEVSMLELAAPALARRTTLHLAQVSPDAFDPWQDYAACLGKTWMAVRGRADEARAVCSACPVEVACRLWVTTDPAGATIPGIIAGLSLEQRGGVECRCGATYAKAQTRKGLCWNCLRGDRKVA